MSEIEQLVAAMTSSRQIDLPRFLRVVEDSAALEREIAAVLEQLEITSPLFVSGTSQSAAVCTDLNVSSHETVENNTRAEVLRIAERIGSGHDGVVAVGGGRPIDVAKAACLLADVQVMVIPTQLSTDSIASPVSVITEAGGYAVSERSQLPVAVVADLETLAGAPAAFARAGIGDVISNRTAIVDWRLAAQQGDPQVDDFAALLASCACLLIENLDLSGLCSGTVTLELARRLLDGLVLSGLAMEIAGSSRPCSGSEHLISHALDRLEPGTAAHGEQVAFGTIVATALQGGDVAPVKGIIKSAGMSGAATGFGLPVERLAEIIQFAPATRPGRYTVIDGARPTGRDLRALLTRLLDR